MDFSAVLWEAEASKDAEIKFRNAFHRGCFCVLMVVAIPEQSRSQQRKHKNKRNDHLNLFKSPRYVCVQLGRWTLMEKSSHLHNPKYFAFPHLSIMFQPWIFNAGLILPCGNVTGRAVLFAWSVWSWAALSAGQSTTDQNGKLESRIFSCCRCALFWRLAVALLESTRLSICTSVVFCKGILRARLVSLSGGLTITRIAGLYHASSVKSRTLCASVVVWPWNKAAYVCLSKFPILRWCIFSSIFLMGIDFWFLGCRKAAILSALQTSEQKLHVMSLSAILCM